jgi:hypothetical protein
MQNQELWEANPFADSIGSAVSSAKGFASRNSGTSDYRQRQLARTKLPEIVSS